MIEKLSTDYFKPVLQSHELSLASPTMQLIVETTSLVLITQQLLTYI